MGQPYIGLHDADGSQLLPLLVEPTTDPVLVEKFEVAPPSVRAQEDNRPQASGIYDRTAYIGTAAVSLEGVFVGDDADSPWAYADQLKRLSRPSSRVWFHVQRADWDAPRRILVRGDSPTITYTDLQPAFQFGYKAPDGVFEAVTEQSVRIFPFRSESPGLSEPVSEPVYTEPGGDSGGRNIVVDGTAECYPIVDLYGPGNGAVAIENLTTGQVVQLKETTVVDAEHFLRIDFAAHSLLLDGDPTLSRRGFLDFPASDWWALEPGPASVSLTVHFPGAGCQALLRWRPRYTI